MKGGIIMNARRKRWNPAKAGMLVALATGAALSLSAPADAAVRSTASGYAATAHHFDALSATASQHSVAAGPVTGELKAGEWTKVLWGWGFYSVDYYASISMSGGKYRCYPGGSGDLPRRITHTVAFYGDCWLYSPGDATYALWPVGP